MTIKELFPNSHLHRSEKIGEIPGRGDRMLPILQDVAIINTPSGNYRDTEWLDRIKEAIREEGQEELYNRIVMFCGEYASWENMEQLEIHAAECLCEGTYKLWKDFW